MINLDIKALELQFNQLTLRERVISFAGLLICSLSIAYFLMFDPANMAFTKADKKLQASHAQQLPIKHEIEQIKIRLQQDPLKIINNEIMVLKQTLLSLNKALDLRLVKFIHANKMSLALTKVLAKSPGIKVNYLKSLAVKSFTATSTKAEGKATPLFYKHSLEIQLSGNYNSVYQYLLNMEALQDNFYWSSLKYEVTTYPLAVITLQIYTLSDQQDLVSG